MAPRRLPQDDEVEVRLVTAAAITLEARGGLSPPVAVGAAAATAAASAAAMTAAMTTTTMVVNPR